MSNAVTRLAPSPTGALHLGNARTFLINWLLAKQNGWQVIFRMEDLDTPRTKADAAQQAIDELAWLGLDWEGDIVYQSNRHDAYREALDYLIEAGHAYPCICSRKDVQQAASAPHASDHQMAYPGTCRKRFDSHMQAADTGQPISWRLRVYDEMIQFDDAFAGRQEFDMQDICGDFVIYRNEGLAAYQLAVVLDDQAAGVTYIVRGDDLLDSAARQIHLRKLLGYRNEITYYHLPLVIGEDGRRLAKRHGDTRLQYYTKLGVPVERILGLLAYWSGQIPRREEIGLPDLLARFDINTLPHIPTVFTSEDDQFLRGT